MLIEKEIRDLANEKEYVKVFNYFHDEYTEIINQGKTSKNKYYSIYYRKNDNTGYNFFCNYKCNIWNYNN